MRNIAPRLWLGALCAVALVGQQVARADDDKNDAKPVEIHQSLKAEESVQYRNTLKLMVGGEIVVEQNRKRTIKEIKDNGEVVIVLTDLGGKVSFNGSDMETPAGGPTTLTMTKQGKVLSYKPESDNPYLSLSTLHLITLLEHIVYPEKAVKAGDSWTTEVDNPQVKGKKATIKTTYVGAEKADGVAAWKVKQTFKADTDSGEITAEVTALLDAANGQVIEAEQNVKGIPTQMGAMDWTGKTKRMKPDADKDKAEKKN
jgi:hypothetical protein